MLFSPQIPLQLEPRREQDFDHFVAGPNEAVLQSLRGIVDGPELQAYLWGPPSSGKTHLLNALCLATRSRGGSAFYAGLKNLPTGSQALLDGLEQVDLLCIDDCEHAAGDAEWETALFHCINRFRDAGRKLVLASREPLGSLPLNLPDLKSRLQWGLRLQLQALGDEQKLLVLGRYASSLGIELPEELGRYLLRRHARRLDRLIAALEQLQQAAFVGKRRLTVPLAREVLGPTMESTDH
ncbi:MAG: DnaA regulatory inactivator Hda [Xanthomonadales bacterium]|nr:DnaA regulatory inactivator Hda [Xanthomonadales bacterium]